MELNKPRRESESNIKPDSMRDIGSEAIKATNETYPSSVDDRQTSNGFDSVLAPPADYKPSLSSARTPEDPEHRPDQHDTSNEEVDDDPVPQADGGDAGDKPPTNPPTSQDGAFEDDENNDNPKKDELLASPPSEADPLAFLARKIQGDLSRRAGEILERMSDEEREEALDEITKAADKGRADLSNALDDVRDTLKPESPSDTTDPDHPEEVAREVEAHLSEYPTEIEGDVTDHIPAQRTAKDADNPRGVTEDHPDHPTPDNYYDKTIPEQPDALHDVDPVEEAVRASMEKVIDDETFQHGIDPRATTLEREARKAYAARQGYAPERESPTPPFNVNTGYRTNSHPLSGWQEIPRETEGPGQSLLDLEVGRGELIAFGAGRNADIHIHASTGRGGAVAYVFNPDARIGAVFEVPNTHAIQNGDTDRVVERFFTAAREAAGPDTTFVGGVYGGPTHVDTSQLEGTLPVGTVTQSTVAKVIETAAAFAGFDAAIECRYPDPQPGGLYSTRTEPSMTVVAERRGVYGFPTDGITHDEGDMEGDI